MASSTEEVSGTNDVSTDSKQHDTTDTEQKFGMYMREFDFLEYELESLEVIFRYNFMNKLSIDAWKQLSSIPKFKTNLNQWFIATTATKSI